MNADAEPGPARAGGVVAAKRLGAVPFLALTALGLGCLRPAPGTWGSLPPCIVALLLLVIGAPAWQIHVCMALLILAGSIACVRFGSMGEEAFGKKDPGRVVADEVAGQAIALISLPWRELPDRTLFGHLTSPQLLLVGAAFFAFRFFDVLKPPPARELQRVRGGWGILLDDIAAGLMALGAGWFLAVSIQRAM